MFTAILLAGVAWMVIAMIFILSLVAAARRKPIPDPSGATTDPLPSNLITNDCEPATADFDLSPVEVATRPLPA